MASPLGNDQTPTSVLPLGTYSFFTNVANFAYAGRTSSLIAARPAVFSRVLSASEKFAGKLLNGWANGVWSGASVAILLVWSTTFSSRNFGGIKPLAMPLRMLAVF